MSPPDQRVTIVDRPDRDQYEIELDGRRVGLLAYRVADGAITHSHTEIDPSVGGRGLGSALVRFALDDARARGLTVMPRCPFVAAFIERHPDYEDLVTT
ncbi:MAG: GNAT family N-acetyltransferase [Solirubrobacteraceae bacterium]